MSFADEIKKGAQNDLQSIEEICLAMWEPLYRFIYFKVQNREEAEDITQETFVRALTHWQGQKSRFNNSPGFLKTVALNILRDRWRQMKRRGIPIDFNKVNPGQLAGDDEQRAIIQRLQIQNALAKLSEDQQKVLDLRLIKGYSVAETARITGKTEAAVRTTQYRALKNLAQILDSSRRDE